MEYTEITYAKNVVNFSGDDKAVPAVYRSWCTKLSVHSALLISPCMSSPFALLPLFRYFPPAVAKVYIVTFRSHNDDRPSKFIVLADNMKSAINMAWEHGGADFQSRFDKSTAQTEQMKEGALRVL